MDVASVNGENSEARHVRPGEAALLIQNALQASLTEAKMSLPISLAHRDEVWML